MDSSKRMSFIREENLIERYSTIKYSQIQKILWCQAELIACHVSSTLILLLTFITLAFLSSCHNYDHAFRFLLGEF